MNEPRRLVDDPNGSALARALLASARGDEPSSAGRVRVARRLGIVAILTAGSGLGTKAGALAVAGKLSAVVVALGAVVGLAALQSPPAPPPEVPARLRHEGRPSAMLGEPRPEAPIAIAEPQPEAPTTLEPRTTAPAPTTLDEPRATAPAPTTLDEPRRPAPRPRATPAPRAPTGPRASAHAAHAPAPAPRTPAAPLPADAVTEPIAAPPAPEPAAETAPDETPPDEPTAPQSAEPAPAAAPAPVSPSRLAAQVALVDLARDRLAAGDHLAALAALAEYHQRFPSGDLDAEADVVRIETVIALGEARRARALGAAFLTRFPRSPLAQRVRSLLERLPH
jgi:TolA-binding protein